MRISKGRGKTQYGPGVQIDLTSVDLFHAIHAFIVANGVNIVGPMTVSINDEICRDCHAGIYVDPSGFVNTPQGEIFGNGTDNRE